MKNKKGFLLLGEYTVNIVIALLVLLILAYLGFRFFGMINDRNQKALAESHLNNIADQIDLLNDGEETTYFLNSPNGWSLGYYSDNLIIESNQYLLKKIEANPGCDKNCLCICSFKSTISSVGTGGYGFSLTILNCRDFGVCVEFEKDIIISLDNSDKKTFLFVDSLVKEGKNLIIKQQEGVVRIYPE